MTGQFKFRFLAALVVGTLFIPYVSYAQSQLLPGEHDWLAPILEPMPDATNGYSAPCIDAFGYFYDCPHPEYGNWPNDVSEDFSDCAGGSEKIPCEGGEPFVLSYPILAEYTQTCVNTDNSYIAAGVYEDPRGN